MTEIDWPAGFDRTPASDREPNRSFEATIADTTRDLTTKLDRMGVDEWRASTGSGGAHTKTNGLPKHSANPADPGFALYWTKDGQQYAVACDASPSLRDNMRYCYKWINETRMRSNRPVETGKSEFATARLPSGNEDAVAADPPAHVVLGVDRDAAPAEIESAFRDKVSEVHPDAGGSAEAFKRAQRAKEELLPDDDKCVTDGGTPTDTCDEMAILRRIPTNCHTTPARQWIVGDRDDTEIDPADLELALLWADHNVALRSSFTDDQPGYHYHVDQHGDLAFCHAETGDRVAMSDARAELADDLADPAVSVEAILVDETAPEHLRSVGKQIVCDGGRDTRVGHCKHDDTDVYAGRGQNGRDMLSVAKPGKRGWLGNPFTLDNHSRAESIDAFRTVFEDLLHRDEEFRAAVADLHGKTLGCWCQHVSDTEPGCHAEVIADWADRLAREGEAALEDAETVESEEIVTDGGHETADCHVCGERTTLDGDRGIRRFGNALCRDCSDEPVVFVARCQSGLCEWSHRVEGNEFNRGHLRTRCEQEANWHESTKRELDDEHCHKTHVEEIEDPAPKADDGEPVTDGGQPNYDHEIAAADVLNAFAADAADYAHDHDEKRRRWRESFDMASEFHDARYWMLEALGGRRAYHDAMIELQSGGRFRNEDGTVKLRGFMAWLSDRAESAHERSHGDYTETRQADEAETAYTEMLSTLRDEFGVGWPRLDDLGGNPLECDMP